MKRHFALALGAGIMIAGCAMPNASFARPGTIAWAPHVHELRSGESVEAQMGTLEVPVSRADPASGAMTLHFVRLPAHAGASGPPIIYLAGGPGGSGIEAGQGDRARMFDRLRRHGDVILLDQRGAGISSPPPACSNSWNFPSSEAATEASINASLEAALRSCAAEWRAAGVKLDAYNTAENAADVADLIRALGVPKANLVGISYGTFLGFAVLRDHGNLIERAVFAGTEGPDHTLKLPTQADTALSALSAEIASTPEGLAASADLEGSVRRVFARLAEGPVTVEQEDGQSMTVGLYDAQLVTFFLMATSENAVRLPGLFQAMEAGNFGPLAGMVRLLRRFYGALPAMPFAMDAASGATAEREREVRRLASSSIFGNAVNFPSADLAGALGVPLLPDRYRAPLRTDVPAFFISGTLDSRTPPANAEEVRQGFRESAHLVLDGAGHDNDLFLSTPVILDRIDAFFAGQPVRDEKVEVDILKFD